MTKTRHSAEEKTDKNKTTQVDEAKRNGDCSAVTDHNENDIQIGVDIYFHDTAVTKPKTFKKSWLQKWSWLSQNDVGSMICKSCTEQDMKNNFTTGCSNFRTSSLRRHAGTRDHKKAMVEVGLADSLDEIKKQEKTSADDSVDTDICVDDSSDERGNLENKLMPRPSLVVEARPLVGIKRNYRDAAKPVVPPKRKRIRKSKTFQNHWKKEWPWLDRNESGGMICKYCIDNNMTNAFTVGCNNYRTSSLKRHSETKDHVYSVVEYDHEVHSEKEDNTTKLLEEWSWLKKNENGAMVCIYCIDANKSNSFTIGCYNVRTSALKRHADSRDHKLSLPDTAKESENDFFDDIASADDIMDDIASRDDVPVFRKPRRERKKKSKGGNKEKGERKKRDRSQESNRKNFQSSWIKIWPWLELNENGAMVCKYCMVNDLANAFTTGCSNFRTSSVRRHAGTRDHESSVKVFESLVEVKE